MADIERIIEGEGGRDYLVRSIAIVTLLYENGALGELIESGRLSLEDIDARAAIIKERYPGFVQSAEKAPEENIDEMEMPE